MQALDADLLKAGVPHRHQAGQRREEAKPLIAGAEYRDQDRTRPAPSQQVSRMRSAASYARIDRLSPRSIAADKRSAVGAKSR
jgi:hypothetical protein